MKVFLNHDNGVYLVDAYVQMAGERWPSWHTLRAFKHQGDAIVFRDIVNRKGLDVLRYIKSYRRGTFAESLTTKNGLPVMKVKEICSTKN